MSLNNKLKCFLAGGLLTSLIFWSDSLNKPSNIEERPKYEIVTCNSIYDKDGDKIIDFPSEVNGLKDTFYKNEKLWICFFANEVYMGKQLELVLSDSTGRKIKELSDISKDKKFSAIIKYERGLGIEGKYNLEAYCDKILVAKKKFFVVN